MTTKTNMGVNKVLFISNYIPSKGGISTQIDVLVKYLNNENFEIKVISTAGNIIKRFISFFEIIFRSKGYKVFHIHGCSYRGFLPIVFGTIGGRLTGKRIIVTFHGGGADPFLKKYNYIVKCFLKLADQITVPSKFLFEIFKQYNINCCIVPNIIEFNNNNFKKRTKFAPKLITTRTLEAIYNIENTIKTFKLVKERYNDASLTIVGDGSYREKLEKLVKQEKLKDVTFTGNVPNNLIINYLSSSDIYLNSSLIDNLPMSIIEAFSNGLPVISSNVGGIPFMINHLENGVLVKPNDPIEMSNQVFFLIENPSITCNLISNATKSLIQYRWEEIKVNLFNIYKL